jgi:putative transposase
VWGLLLLDYKYELMPDDQQERQIRCFAGSCWFVYNKALVLLL